MFKVKLRAHKTNKNTRTYVVSPLKQTNQKYDAVHVSFSPVILVACTADHSVFCFNSWFIKENKVRSFCISAIFSLIYLRTRVLHGPVICFGL